MKKKKWMVLGGVVGISGVMMVTTGLSAMAGTSGYDTYKSAFKNMKTVQNVSIHTQAQLQDNGNELVSGQGDLKMSHSDQTGSGTVKVNSNGSEMTVNFYRQNDQTVFKTGASDVYYVTPERKGKWNAEKKTEDGQMQQQVETVIDALVGNLKDYVTEESKADGSKQVSVELTNAQIPAVVNAIAPIAIKQATSGHKHFGDNKTSSAELPFDPKQLRPNLPQLSHDINIEKVAIKADINAANYIEHQQADVTVSGKDANGTSHELTLHLSADLSGYNNTTPDTVDLTGKEVKQIKQQHDIRQSKQAK